MVWGGANQGVDRLVLEDAAEIVDRTRLLARDLADRLDGTGQSFLVDAAQVRHLAAGLPLELLGQAGPTTAHAHHPDPQTPAGCFFGSPRVGRNAHGGAARRSGSQKPTPIHGT